MNEYDRYKEPEDFEVGTCKCECCGSEGKLILRQGKQFRRWFCECPNGHRPEIKEEINDIFQIGDRIRIYDTPFDINKKIDFTSYQEGFIVAKENGAIRYYLDMKIDKAIHQNEDVKKTSWIYGHIVRGIASDSNSLEPLTPQLKFEIA